MTTNAVKIGPEFFAKAKNEYADWYFALIREFVQNSVDCGSSLIDISVALEDGDTRLVVRNDGDVMSEDILVNKLLALGGSGKNFVGAIGGFGAAKLLLYFCHKHYRIHSGSLLVDGTGGNYDLTESEFLAGTESSILLGGRIQTLLENQIARCAALTQWSGILMVNGKAITTRLIKGARRKDFTWGTVYTNNSEQGVLLVRMGGIPMFTKPIRYKGMVLVELTGTSGDVLTSNRDGLRYQQQSELDMFIAEIAVNTRSAFKDKAKKVKKVRFAGYRLVGEVDLGAAVKIQDVPGASIITRVAAATTTGGTKESADAPIAESTIRELFRPEFFLKSEIDGKIPEWFVPGKQFSSNSKRLVSNWISILVELATLTKDRTPFAVGFIFDPDCVAQCETENGQRVLYISPVSILEKPGKPRQLKVRWSFNAEGNWNLLAVAAHERTHHMGCDSHDEDYAAKLTEIFGLIMTNRTRFSRHFSAPVAWPDEDC